jgi:hypothetical protein
MKFGPKGLAFTWPAWTLFRRHLAIIGRDNTLHLQETALVIEGDLIRFGLPVFDVFVKRAFAERSLVTIPYSRIVGLTRACYITVKALWWLLTIAVFATIASTVWDPNNSGDSLYYLGLVGLMLLLQGYLMHRFFRSRHVLLFRRADGDRCVVCFCLTSRKRRRQFVDLLRTNRDAARALATPAGERNRRILGDG